MCQKLTAGGKRVPASEQVCGTRVGPPIVRTCRMPACPSKQLPHLATVHGEEGPGYRFCSGGDGPALTSCWGLRDGSSLGAPGCV